MKRSTVIKAGTLGTVAADGIYAFELADMMNEAQQALDEARAEGRRIIERAEQEARQVRAGVARIHEEATQAGFEQGLVQGRQHGRDTGRAEALELARKEFSEQQGKLMASNRQMLAELNEHKLAWEAGARRDLVDLAMAVAQRVTRCVGERDRQVVAANIEEAIRLVGARTDVIVAVNPQDADAARRLGDADRSAGERWEHVRVVEDPAITAGGCKISWGSGGLDATLETQLARIEAAIRASDEPAGS